MNRVGIISCTGKMGNALTKACQQNQNLKLTAGISKPNHPLIGQDLGTTINEKLNIPITDSLEKALNDIDILIDFSLPHISLKNIELCQKHNKKMVIGTTGFTEKEQQNIHQAAKNTAIVYAPNMSIGINLTLKVLELITEKIGKEADIEIIEAHHRNKIDAPSGTALKMGEVIANTLGQNLQEDAIYGRQGQTGPRNKKTIGFSTIRAGDIVGEHTALFALEGERIEITHKATNRMTFAQGAITAAQWLIKQKPGLYDMQDVLELK